MKTTGVTNFVVVVVVAVDPMMIFAAAFRAPRHFRVYRAKGKTSSSLGAIRNAVRGSRVSFSNPEAFPFLPLPHRGCHRRRY